MDMTLTVDQNGNLELPSAVREALHIVPGDEVAVEIETDQIVLRRIEPAIQKRVGNLLMWTGEIDSSALDTLEVVREERMRNVGGF